MNIEKFSTFPNATSLAFKIRREHPFIFPKVTWKRQHSTGCFNCLEMIEALRRAMSTILQSHALPKSQGHLSINYKYPTWIFLCDNQAWKWFWKDAKLIHICHRECLHGSVQRKSLHYMKRCWKHSKQRVHASAAVTVRSGLVNRLR